MEDKNRKQNGVVFTPSWIADFMVEEVFMGHKITGKEKILDAGCGEGVFTISAVKTFARLSRKSIESVIEDNIYFIDISKEHLQKTKENLKSLTSKKIKKFNEFNGDFCFYDFSVDFDFIIGNPPYVRIQNLNDRREELQKRFFTAVGGSIDLYFCFFERAISLLRESGRIVFITPNSHFYSLAGRNLRQLLAPLITKIIDFDHFQVFKEATAYTAITFLDKDGVKKNLFYTKNFKNNFSDLSFKEIIKKEIGLDKWRFLDDKYAKEISFLKKSHSVLGEIADIHYGIATLKDDVYIFSPEKQDEKYFYLNSRKIEKDICVPIIKASTYKGDNQNLFLIFPYKDEKVILEDIFKKKYPNTYNYFLAHKDELLKRDKGGGENYKVFYAFGRNQGLKTSFGKKIITSTMNLYPRFYVVEDEKMSFYAGYCIKPKKDIDLYELCDILNSDSMRLYIESVSKSYRGGYKSYAKSFLKDFIHPYFIKDQKSLF